MESAYRPMSRHHDAYSRGQLGSPDSIDPPATCDITLDEAGFVELAGFNPSFLGISSAEATFTNRLSSSAPLTQARKSFLFCFLIYLMSFKFQDVFPLSTMYNPL